MILYFVGFPSYLITDAEVGPTTRPSRASTVEDVRRQYVFGNLPSFGGEDASDSAELEIIRKEVGLYKV